MKGSRRELFKTMLSLLPFAAYGGVFIKDQSGALKPVERFGRKQYLLPPGARELKEFMSRCIRCHRCGEACPNSTITFIDAPEHPSVNGLPGIRPREKACITCMKCGQACPTGAIQAVPDGSGENVRKFVKMGTAEVDKNLCYSYNNYSCGACTQACPFEYEAIKAGQWERPEVNADLCVGCGLCEQACIHYPQAIRVAPAPGKSVTV